MIGEGVTTFVDLTRWDERLFYSIHDYRGLLPEGVKRLGFPLWTYWLPPIGKLLEIVGAVEGNVSCYLHCRQGIDRTGVIAVLLLVCRGMPFDEALSYLSSLRGVDSPRKPYHIRYLKKYLNASRKFALDSTSSADKSRGPC